MIYNFFDSQRKYRSSKDWVTTVLSVLKELDLKLNFQDIMHMKKGEFMNQVKKKIECKTLEGLKKVKESHSKVKKLDPFFKDI